MKTKSIVSRYWIFVISIGLLAIGFYGCGGGNKSQGGMDKQALIDSIKSTEAKLKTIVTPDAVIYNRAIGNYLKFASNFPDDTMAPACLFNAANISMSLNQYQRAVNLYDSVVVKYPNFKKAADCIFIRGFIYDDKLKDTANARKMYQLVIDKYPHDSLASQARAALSILGKSYDEIIKEFEEKNKEQKKS
jgi:tetratricopeptide (TPR) repeat protein